MQFVVFIFLTFISLHIYLVTFSILENLAEDWNWIGIPDKSTIVDSSSAFAPSGGV